MADIVGEIRPVLDARLTAIVGWEEPYKTVVVTDQTGRRHGRIEWLTAEADDAAFAAAVLEMYLALSHATRTTSEPSAAS